MFGSHFWTNTYEIITYIHKYFTLKLYTHVYLYKMLMHMKCSVDSFKYFTFESHIWSFSSMIPLLFHVWQSHLFLANIYQVITAIHKYFTLKLYTQVYI